MDNKNNNQNLLDLAVTEWVNIILTQIRYKKAIQDLPNEEKEETYE